MFCLILFGFLTQVECITKDYSSYLKLSVPPTLTFTLGEKNNLFIIVKYDAKIVSRGTRK